MLIIFYSKALALCSLFAKGENRTASQTSLGKCVNFKSNTAVVNNGTLGFFFFFFLNLLFVEGFDLVALTESGNVRGTFVF